MYLHIGNGKNIRIKDIVGIFDADTSTQSAVTKKYLIEASKKDKVNSVSAELPKSFVVYRKNGRCEIYFSPLSVQTLSRRMNSAKTDEVEFQRKAES